MVECTAFSGALGDACEDDVANHMGCMKGLEDATELDVKPVA